MKRCYYDILEVDNKATTSQIKKSYYKMALKYHPDKNPGEDAKKLFLEIAEAYEVLSDPNERTWYDNNREKILFNKEEMSKEDIEAYSFGFNIWNYFTVKCFNGFEDDDKGFYAVYRDVFERIKAEEAKSYAMRDDLEEEMRKFQGFGDSLTNLQKVLRFYQDWESFSTYKTFIWSEEWDTREAPNRYVRREMEKQNKKERFKEKKTYIKTIKDLISFLKKRDPRYKEYVLKMKEEDQLKAKQKVVKEEQKKKEKEEMKKVKQQLEEERFKEIEEYFQKQKQGLSSQGQENNHREETDQQFHCPVCDKNFKSENQLINHQKSKMHKQAVKAIQKQVMLKEQIIEQGIKAAEQPVQENPVKKKNKKNKKKNKNKNNDQQKSENESDQQQSNQKTKEIQKKEVQKKQKKPQSKKEQKVEIKVEKQEEPEDSDEDDQDAFMSAMLGNKKKNDIRIDNESNMPKKNGGKPNKMQQKKIEQSASEEQDNNQTKKPNKAKLKRQKKAEQVQKDTGFKCNVCSQSYPSKTKLFDHVKKLNHALKK